MKTEQCIFYACPCYREYHHTDMSHGLACHHVARLRRGTARVVTLSGEELLLQRGDVFYFPTGMRYHSYWRGDSEGADCRVEWDSVGFVYFPDDAGRHYAPQILRPDGEGMALLERLMAQPFVTMTSSGWLYLFLGRVLPDMVETRTDAGQRVIERVRRYMEGQPSCSVDELARHCGMSQSSLYALFRERSSESISEMRNRVRVEQAIDLLGTTDLSIEEISRRLNFCSAAYFRAVFRKITGRAPTDVRRENGGRRML